MSPAADPTLNDIRLDLWPFAPAGRFGPVFPDAGTTLKDVQPDLPAAPPSDGFSNSLTLRNLSGLLDVDDFALVVGPFPVVEPPLVVGPFPVEPPLVVGEEAVWLQCHKCHAGRLRRA